MRRQLYRGGGIAGLYPRQKYGLGSWVKERVRKIIPNELADVAVKAAPFVAPFNPAVAAAMRGIGRFDQRGSLSDAFKQAALTYGGGQLTRGIGGAGFQGNPFTEGGAFRGGLEGFRSGFSSPLSPERTQSFKNLFKSKDASSKKLKTSDYHLDKSQEWLPGDAISTVPETGTISYEPSSLKNIWNTWQNMDPGMKTAIVGVGSGAIAGVAQWFENQIPQEPGESMEEYLARRKVAVAKLMRQYMDNTRAYDPAWTTMTDQQKDETVAQYNMNKGGRVGYQTGGITMANTLAQNIAANRAQAAANEGVLAAARSRLPGYVAPQKAMAPTPAPITLPVQPPERPDVVERVLPMPIEPDMPIGKFPTPPGGDVQPILPVEPPKKVLPVEPPKKVLPMEPPKKVLPMDPTKMIPQLQTLDPDLEQAIKNAKTVGAGEEYIDTMLRERQDSDAINFYKDLTPQPPKKVLPIEEIDQIDMTKPPGTPSGDGALTVMPQYNDPIPYEQLMAGFEQFKKDNPEVMQGAGTAAMVPVTLPGGYDYSFSGSLEANAFRKYLESIGQAPYQGRRIPGDLKKIEGGLSKLNQGGRVGQMHGTGPAGLPGIPRMAPDGMEFDMRMNGGFQPLGAKEGKDDVPAMLAKNEFVFTADAVRGAGNGNIELGAQRMYDTMKNLEKRMA